MKGGVGREGGGGKEPFQTHFSSPEEQPHMQDFVMSLATIVFLSLVYIDGNGIGKWDGRASDTHERKKKKKPLAHAVTYALRSRSRRKLRQNTRIFFVWQALPYQSFQTL